MNKKAISILLTAAMGVSVLAAGTVTVSAAEKKDKYVIGMSQCNLGEPWRVAMNDQIAMAAEKHPEFEVIFADAAQDNSKQIADIENFVQMGVDLIITSPNEATPLTNAVSAAYDAGIPVILLDRKIDGDKYTQFIGADNVDMGRIAGEYIADTLLPDGGKVCEIKGLEGTSGGIDRDNGFREGIKKNDKIEIVAVNNADWLMNLNYVEVLRDVGPHFSVNRMLSHECYKQRMERGLTFLEFNYMIMQSYDFYMLYQKYGCTMQFGGDDQWANMLGGTELIRRKLGKDAYAMTITLLLNSEGKKMGKTQSGAVWLDPEKTSPFAF